MEAFDESGTAAAMEMGLPMDMVAEEVVTQDEGGADSDGLAAAMESLTSQPSVNILSKFGKELGYLEDSSEDEDEPHPSPAVSRLNVGEEEGGDVWSGSGKDDCLCWECGERFYSLERLMVHFRKHEACVRCNMCQVTFRRVVSLSMHLDNVHNHVDLYCAPCHRSFHSKWDLNEHLGKHSEGSELPVSLGLPPPWLGPQEETEVCLAASDTEEDEPVPEPASFPMSASAPIPVSVSAPVPVSGPIPVSVSAPVPVSGPIPVSVSAPIPVSGPIPVSVPASVPVSGPVPLSGPVPPSVPVSGPVSPSVPVSAPVPLAVPMSIPIFLPVSIPITLPVPVPLTVSVPGPNSVPVSAPAPGSVPVAISTASPSSTAEVRASPLDESTLHELVARDHTYNNSCKTTNGTAPGTYALRLRQTKRLTKGFPTQNLPESAHQKKIHLFLFRNVDQQQEKFERVEGGKRDRRMEEFAKEKDVKPETSSLILPLSHSLASSEQGVNLEGGDPCNEIGQWDGEPIEEDEDFDHSGESDEMASIGDRSEYDPGSASDVSTESFSSGNSSGSSYTPNKRQGKRITTRRRLRVKKLSKAGSSQVAIAPAQQPVLSEPAKFQQNSIKQPSLQARAQAALKQNVSDTFAPGGNKALSRPALRPSRMYACDQCREVFPEQVTYRRHHCPMKTVAIKSWSNPTSIPVPVTTATTIQNPTVISIPAPMAQKTITVPSASSLVSKSGPVLSSSSGTMKVTQMAVPCTLQNSTLVSPLPVASGPVFTLPSIMLPSPSPSVQSGSRPIMATVVFNGNGSTGRVTRLVLQSQGLTLPTHTVSQTRPIRLSVPTQANPSTPGQVSPSMQLTNLMLGGLIQPQMLVKSPHLTLPSASSPISAPGPGPTSASAPMPDSILIPAPVTVPITAPTLTSVAGLAPISSPSLIPATAPIKISTPIIGPTSVTPPAPKTILTPINTSIHIPALLPVPASFSTPDPGPLRILGMFANRSQELALQKRLKKSWRSKGVFLCRQCGAVSRQPSLGVRHRYLHRGSRRHRCHCGRTFLHRLHLLRHHVQHAESTRFVCAPCGQTFFGARCLARHKQDQEGKRDMKKRARSRKDCHAPFSCDCGQIFQRPAAFLWHKLKNPRQLGVGLKRTQRDYPSDNTASQMKTSPL